ncbi:MAG: serine hydrolase [Flavobacteriaceae bacterium]|nr:serine hydrolase [Flavobacteriaceae bacterium]
MKKIGFSLMALVLFVVYTTNAQLSTKQIDALVTNALQKFNVAGAGIAVVKDGKVVYLKGYGITSAKTKKKVNAHTRFAIASNSKAFTSMALAILVDRKQLNWNDKVVDYIPEFKMYNAYVTANFTIVDLLTHRSGLGLGAGDLMFFPDGGNFTMDDVVKSFQYQKPQSGFRTKFDYDNLLYMVAGEVVKRISDKSWPAFVEENIMKPLGMNESAGTYQRLADKNNVATPHSDIDDTLVPLKPFDDSVGASAGGIYASISDLTKWVGMHLNNGKYADTTLVSLKNHNFIWKPQTNQFFRPIAEPPYKIHFVSYGLGWNVMDLNGYMVFSHTGGLPGMLSKILLIPEMGLGIIVLTNTDPGGGAFFSAVTNTIRDSYLGLDDFGWADKYAKRLKSILEKGDAVTEKVWQTVEKSKNTTVNTANFIGIYKDNWFGKIKIYLKDNRLWFEALRSPKLNGPMAFYKANTFAIKWAYQDMNADAFAMFTLDENGKAIGIKMKGISPNIDFSFDFQDLDLKRVEE